MKIKLTPAEFKIAVDFLNSFPLYPIHRVDDVDLTFVADPVEYWKWVLDALVHHLRRSNVLTDETAQLFANLTINISEDLKAEMEEVDEQDG